MFVLRRTPAALALLLLAAHFLRFGQVPGVGLCLLLLVPLFVPHRGAQAVVRGSLVLGALVWVWTLVQDVQERLALGVPWLRLAFILGAVALWTGWSAWLLRSTERRRG